jgi:hypothetical protein
MPNWIPIVSDVDRNRVKGWVGKAPPGTMIAFKKHDARSIEQNALLWSRLSEISENVEWYGEKLAPEDWKNIFSAALRSYKVVPGLNPNTRVPLGLRTSSLNRSEMTALLELISAFAAERGVTLSDEADGS